MRSLRAVAAIPLLALVFAACGGSGTVSRKSPTSESAPKSAGDSDILAFKAPKLGGGEVDGGDLAGKDVAVWFWAPW
jgi:hypothetical protein